MYVNGKKLQRQAAAAGAVAALLLLPFDASALAALLAQNIYMYILYNNRFTICLNLCSLSPLLKATELHTFTVCNYCFCFAPAWSHTQGCVYRVYRYWNWQSIASRVISSCKYKIWNEKKEKQIPIMNLLIIFVHIQIVISHYINDMN